MMEQTVLDHGLVRLVDSMGNDLSVVRSARVSYDAAWRAGKDTGSDERLIHRLAEGGHNTPFESVEFQFEIRAPIFVVRQWHRHRTQSYNELSARYRELPEVFYVPEAEQITTQSSDNKQMRTDEVNPRAAAMRIMMRKQNEQSFATYRRLIEGGCPRELARSVLPTGTYTHMFAKMNLNNLIKFLKERTHPHAQYEIRVFADAMLEMARSVAPISVSAWMD